MDNLNLVVKTVFGSHLYGTAVENSDKDYKGIFLPSEEEILLNKVPKSYKYNTNDSGNKNSSEDIDIELFSLHYFIKLACKGQTVALDILHAPDDMIIEKSPLWDDIQEHRDKFYTKNLDAFVEYARTQAAKYGVKGSRLAALKAVINVLEEAPSKAPLKDIWDELPRGEHIYDNLMDWQKNIRLYQVCGRSFHETAKVWYVLPILKKIYDEYGFRAKQAENNENIDWKAVSHAIRAALQVKELLLYKTIIFPLKEAAYVKAVKEGKLDYITEVSPYLESLMDEVEDLSVKSDLPEEVDDDFWNKFLIKAIKKYVLTDIYRVPS